MLAGVVALVAFPALARLAADRQPVAPGPAVTLPPLSPTPPGAAVRPIPVGLAPGAPTARLADLRPAIVALLGERRASVLMTEVRTPTTPRERYRFPVLERVVPPDVDPAAATTLGARLMLLPDAGADIAAYVLFERARARGGCDPHVNQLFLLAAELPTNLTAIDAAAARAIDACPGDPTPAWLLGQARSQAGPARGIVALRKLRTAFPSSPDAWAAEADGYLRMAYVEAPERVFVTRHLYERALAGYRRALRLGGSRADLNLGMARALAGLNRPKEAVALQRASIAATPPSALLQARLIEYLESAHDFRAGARAAERLEAISAARPTGPALFPITFSELQGLEREDAYAPLSIGTATLRATTVSLGWPAQSPGAPVVDLSFLPVYRPSPGVTGSERWCADWARRRDGLLVGRAQAARTALPPAFEELDVSAPICVGDPAMLAGIASLELGDERAARATRISLQTLQDQRQNLWRWAGDFAHAQRAARQWAAQRPTVVSRIRLGEIEYLRRAYDDAARHFNAAARLARELRPAGSAREAEALLKRGAALIAAGGRRDEGVAALRAADDIAARVRSDDWEKTLIARSWSYYALAQLGDAEREAGALRAAADAYASARALEPRLASSGSPFRVAHLWLNSAIVEVGLGHPDRGRKFARRALNVDPENPLFLMTAGFAAERAGRVDEAIKLNRGALAADHSAYPAANDLGVLLARQGRDQEAVAVLRRSVGASEGYALGWFNLGVVLSGMGLRHLPASQGALARAFALDPALRDRERKPTIDARTYRTGLDVSRPLPPQWNFAATQRHAPERTAGLAALLLVALGLARTLGSTGSGRALAEKWLGPLVGATGRVRLPAFTRSRAVAFAGTLVVLLWPLLRDPSGGLTAALAGALGLLVLVGAAQRARTAVARRSGEAGAQEAWPPGVAFGLGTAFAGFTWTPLPVLRETVTPRLHWAAPVALACVALPLVGLTAWLDIPLTRALASSALIMAASLLTPIKPVDGGAIAAAGGTAAGLTGLGLAALLALGLV